MLTLFNFCIANLFLTWSFVANLTFNVVEGLACNITHIPAIHHSRHWGKNCFLQSISNLLSLPNLEIWKWHVSSHTFCIRKTCEHQHVTFKKWSQWIFSSRQMQNYRPMDFLQKAIIHQFSLRVNGKKKLLSFVSCTELNCAFLNCKQNIRTPEVVITACRYSLPLRKRGLSSTMNTPCFDCSKESLLFQLRGCSCQVQSRLLKL